jgi:hypothetical protein
MLLGNLYYYCISSSDEEEDDENVFSKELLKYSCISYIDSHS